ncbi:unnamed protein product [Cryptosporidium hominis]|uniref:FHA domain-containing protein n=1 Tax=Cryptosporidium hominis TaxID=237895 RepID=A0A0S4TAT6_CRYHO|nr:unnamed protein product [Cryptosporidium hominis]
MQSYKINEFGNEIHNNKINFEPSGLLAKESNSLNGVFLKYSKPSDSCNSYKKWKLYVFKYNYPHDVGKNDNTGILHVNNDSSCGQHVYNETIPLYNNEYYLIGKDARVVNINLKEDSIEDQHAVIQHRVNKKGIPTIYIIDLDSKYGTFINDERIETRRYYELIEKDSIRFGECKNEYILLHDGMI